MYGKVKNDKKGSLCCQTDSDLTVDWLPLVKTAQMSNERERENK